MMIIRSLLAGGCGLAVIAGHSAVADDDGHRVFFPATQSLLESVETPLPVIAHIAPAVVLDDAASPVSELETWRAKVRSNGFLEEETALLSRASDPSDVEVDRDLAYFYFSQGLMPEALKVIDAVPLDHRSAGLYILQAAAQIKLGRANRALDLLETPHVHNLPASAPWRAIAMTQLGSFTSANREFIAAKDTSVPFEEFAAVFFLAKATTAIELGEMNRARAALGKLRTRQLSQEARAERRLLEARLIAAQGNTSAAEALYDSLSGRTVDQITVAARLEKLQLDVNTGAKTIEAALEDLSALSLLWKGDATDRAMLKYRIELLDAAGRKIEALSARRLMVASFPRSDLAERTANQIRETLPRLLDDSSLLPSEAAMAFYENLDFAPPGHLGDVLIENTADALAQLDLLTEAAELLRHQTFNRLRGVDRARVGTKLAQLHLDLRAPEQALGVLSDTMLTRLPETLVQQRAFIQARALTQIGQQEEALGILASLQSDEVLLLRAEIYVASGELMKAANANQTWLDNQDGALDARANKIAIQTAAFYAVLGDTKNLFALQNSIGEKISDPEAAALLNSMTALDFESVGKDFTAQYQNYFRIPETAG